VPGEHALHALHCGPEVGELWGAEFREAAVRAQRTQEDVAWEKGLEVDEGEGVRCGEEDLGEGDGC